MKTLSSIVLSRISYFKISLHIHDVEKVEIIFNIASFPSNALENRTSRLQLH